MPANTTDTRPTFNQTSSLAEASIELSSDADIGEAIAVDPGARDTSLILSPIEISLLQGEVIEHLRSVYDPEIPVNIYDMGLIYDIDVSPMGVVEIQMTLTSPGCPVAGTLPPEVREKAAAVPGVTEAKVELVWEPPWNMDMMTDEAKLELGMY